MGGTTTPLLGLGIPVTGSKGWAEMMDGNLFTLDAAAGTQVDWNLASGLHSIRNKPALAAVATSGSYNDLLNLPVLAASATVDTTNAANITRGILQLWGMVAAPFATADATNNYNSGAFRLTASYWDGAAAQNDSWSISNWDGALLLTHTGTANPTVIFTTGKVGIGTATPGSSLSVPGLPVYATNEAALAGGLQAGDFYRTGANPDAVMVVH